MRRSTASRWRWLVSGSLGVAWLCGPAGAAEPEAPIAAVKDPQVRQAQVETPQFTPQQPPAAAPTQTAPQAPPPTGGTGMNQGISPIPGVDTSTRAGVDSVSPTGSSVPLAGQGNPVLNSAD